jgi:hypothetical protein
MSLESLDLDTRTKPRPTRLFCPQYIPGELATSLMTRVRLLNDLPEVRWEQMLGATSRDARYARDFGARLHRFSQQTEGAYGTAQSLALRTTLSRYFAAGNPILLGLLSQAAERETDIGGLDNWPQRPHGRVRYCLDCAYVDRQVVGYPVAYKEHQLPLSRACWRHGSPLVTAPNTASSFAELARASKLRVDDQSSAQKIARCEKSVLADPEAAARRLKTFIGILSRSMGEVRTESLLKRVEILARRPATPALRQAFALAVRIGGISPLSRNAMAAPLASVLDAMGELEP